MNLILNGTTTLVFIMISALAGCGGKSPSEVACAKSVECGTIQKSAEPQCVADADKASEALNKDEGCKKTREASEELSACVNGLSCADVKDVTNLPKKCPEEFGAVVAAILAESDTCEAAMPIPGGSSESSSGP